MIGRDHVEPARQQLVELEPAARPARRVQEQQRLTLPAAQQVDAATIEFEEFLSRSVCQLVTSVGRPPRPTLGVRQLPGKHQSRRMCRTTRSAAPGLAQGII